MDEIIKNAFYDPDTGYTGTNKLYRKLKKIYPALKLADVKKVLSKQKIVQVNKKESLFFFGVVFEWFKILDRIFCTIIFPLFFRACF